MRGFYIATIIHMARSAIFRWLVVSFIVGIGIESFVRIPVGFVFFTGMGAMMMFAYAGRNGSAYAVLAALLTCGLLAGMVRMGYAKRYAPDLSSFSGMHITIKGILRDDPKFTRSGRQVIMDVSDINGHNLSRVVPIIAFVRAYPPYQAGDELGMEGKLEAKPYDGASAGIIFSAKEEKINGERLFVLLRWLGKAKAAFSGHIDAVLPQPHASFMKGLLLGEKASIPPYLLEEFKQAGVSHIVALSGYNITLVGTFLVGILLMLTVPFWLTFWIALCAIILFVMMTGASASLVRAAIMGILVLVAGREGRMYHMTNALVCAGAIMLMLNPYLIRFDVGFQLSFLATLGLVYLTEPAERAMLRMAYTLRMCLGMRGIPKKEHRVIAGMRRIASETMAAQIAVLPLLTYRFGGFSLIAPVSNVLVLAAVPGTMMLGFSAGMFGFLSSAVSAVVGWCAWLALSYEFAVISVASAIPFSFLRISFAGVVVFTGVYGFFVWRWIMRWYRRRYDDGKARNSVLE